MSTSNSDIIAVQDVINDRVNLTLAQVIERIQYKLNDVEIQRVGISVKTICERYFQDTAVTSLEDCISLEHLGLFLTEIVHVATEKIKVPIRVLPEGFHPGKPNLIVCPKIDMWRSILSIYMELPDQGLPSAAEVLVCCDSTSSEDVELLLRRAIQTPSDKGERIFCLACADEIDFSVAEAAGKMFRQLNQMADKNEKFQLVTLVTSQHHYIAVTFAEYRLNAFIGTEGEIKQYICSNLSTKDFDDDTASVVDHNHYVVRLICSENAGMGKSLYVTRLSEKMSEKFQNKVYSNSVVRFLEKTVNVDDAIRILTQFDNKEVVNADPHFVRIDITPAVQKGVHKFIFDLIILGKIKSANVEVWTRRHCHFYALEYTFPSTQGQISFSNLLDLLPKVSCISPVQVLEQMEKPVSPLEHDFVLMDKTLLENEIYQRPFQYLHRYTNNQNLDEYLYESPNPDALLCLKTLLQYCNINNPSWSELSHFSKFLNIQLSDCEKTCYLNMDSIENFSKADVQLCKLPGFKEFVVRFMIRMSQDFALPSLQLDKKDAKSNQDNKENDLFYSHQLRKRWENDFHPYLFFNADRISFSFVHFNIHNNGNLCNPRTNEAVVQNIMTPQLVVALKNRYKANIQQDFDKLSRQEKLETLCNVFGVKKVFDPDSTYELTTDNVLKLLAIHMRFRSEIPVVLMGETGCGKTRMIDFMSKLKAGGNEKAENMVVVKVHGGVSVADIQRIVEQAIELARKNSEQNLETILFLDEANTTEAIYAIKEIVCDTTVHGKPFPTTGLKIVAACNPYRRQNDDVIKKMELPGLGFHVNTQDVSESFANIPMRNLVYRVVPLPPSMQPLVWDFGRLNDETEEIYIKQMVLKLKSFSDEIQSSAVDIITKCLTASQKYMRENRDVCSFVSLRDVERTILAFKWFYLQRKILSPRIFDEKKKNKKRPMSFSTINQALIHALGVCYHVTLEDRESYRKIIATELEVDQEEILHEITACQNVFIKDIELEEKIGRNEALTENVFMMVVCVELRIPLFLIGRPGSSKSLAKTIVTDAMQGRNSKTDLFKHLKQIHVSSFQCSAVSDAVGIQRVFNQCAQLQEGQSLDSFVAVVVLDEIGLAEGSPKMPLKVLHPLLENATTITQLSVESPSKVGFVGISNWALDPAKMNRGIFVTRGQPTKEDLLKTALAIFESDEETIHQVSYRIIKELTSAYLKVYEKQEKEFFGLRDYYGLMKMLCALLSKKKMLNFDDIAKIVIRNFSGYKTNFFAVFKDCLVTCFKSVRDDMVPVMELIQENLSSDVESRFLLLLTNQYSAVGLLPQVMTFPKEVPTSKVTRSVQDYQVIFGSSFPRDNDYTEVCRNINRIKVCMETCRTVVLLNLRDLYESLYDALNQHYVTLADQRYVDLGLGGHRVKCRIAKHFRLIIIEEKEIVYEKFPIPLINRLEKHVFDMNSILTKDQRNVVDDLKDWIKRFTTLKTTKLMLPSFSEKDTFPGYTEDTPASAFLSSEDHNYESAKKILLQTASLDSVCRLSKSELPLAEAESLVEIYMEEQNHDTLLGLLLIELEALKKKTETLKVLEVTSFSQIIHEKDRSVLKIELELNENSIMLLTLQQFQTERNFLERLDKFFEIVSSSSLSQYILIIQCSQAQLYGNLIACAKYATMNKVKEFQSNFKNCSRVLILFLFNVERNINPQNGKVSFTSFHSRNCDSLYVDELKPSKVHSAPISVLRNRTVSCLIEDSINDIGASNKFLNLMHLVKDCIPEAIAKLKCDDDTHHRRRNRVLLVDQMCFNKAYSKCFLETLGKHIFCLVRDRDERQKDYNSWIVQVACSPEALQEGGSFKHAAWLHLRYLTAIAIAKIVSVLDADYNLDVIKVPEVTDFWLQIFDHTKFFDLRWPDARLAGTFDVKTQFSCSFPFFRLFVEHLQKQWIIVEDGNVEDKRKGFLKSLCNTPTLTLLSLELQASMTSFLKKFIRDLVLYFYDSSSNEELEVETVENCIFNFFQALRERNEIKNNVFLEIFCLFKQIQSKLESFSSIIAVISDTLKDGSTWASEQLQHGKFIVHVRALECLVKKLYDKAPKTTDVRKTLDAVKTCEQWKILVSKTKPVAYGIIQECSEKIQNLWKRLIFLEMFLDQLVPAVASPIIMQKYLAIMAPHARRLANEKYINDFSDLKFLNILTRSLKGCIIEIETKLRCKWQSVTCAARHNSKLVDPVLLPCGKHYACLECVPALLSVDRSCPSCRYVISEDFEVVPISLSVEHAKELKRLKLACSSLFLEYLSTFCFSSRDYITQQSTKVQDKLKVILERLVICDSKLEKLPSLPENFGLDVPSRSNILQLLIDFNPTLITKLLYQHLQSIKTNNEDMADIIVVCINCYRYSLQNKVGNVWKNRNQGKTEVDFALNLIAECAQTDIDSLNQLQQLEYCVKMQYIVQTIVFVCTVHDNRACSFTQKQNELLLNACYLCHDVRFKVVQEAIVKELCRKRGMDAFQILAEIEQLKPLISTFLLSDENEGKADVYVTADMLVLYGSSYRKIKDSLLRITKSSSIPAVMQVVDSEIEESPTKAFEIFLALLMWTHKSTISINLRKETFKQIVKRLKPHFDANQHCEKILDNIADNKLIHLEGSFLTDQMNYRVTELLMVLCATTLFYRNRLLDDLAGLIHAPTEYANAFLPTMPQSGYFDAKAISDQDQIKYSLPPKPFLCPNGHLYFIEECTKRTQASICPHCRQPVGNLENKSHEENQTREITEESQTGYKHDSVVNEKSVTPIRALSKPSVCAVRFCVHAAILLCSKSEEDMRRLTGNKLQSLFLLSCLFQDLKNLSTILGIGVDDAIIIMHEIFRKLRTVTITVDEHICNLKSMASREKWEEEFQRHYLSMVFNDADNIIKETHCSLVKVGCLTKEPLERFVYESNCGDKLPEGTVMWDCPYLWKDRKYVDINQLKQKLEILYTHTTGEGAILKTLVNMENLHLIQHLDIILDLQSSLVRRYRQEIDLADAERVTVRKYLSEDNYSSEKNVNMYIRIWNQVRHSLLSIPRYKPLFEYFEMEMNFSSPISMCIPSKRGRGRCAYVLAEYLISMQNEIVLQCRKYHKPTPSFEQVEASKLTKKDLICMSKNDLVPLIQANHYFETVTDQAGPSHKIAYDFGLLEKKVVEKFISKKAEVKYETVPIMLYPQDVGFSKDFDAVLRNVKQTSLPVRMFHEIDTSAESAQTATICEAVRTVAIIIQFVSKLGADAEDNICNYSEKELLLPPEKAEMIPRAARICHCLALYERLSWHRSKRLIQNGQKPFENVLECAQNIESKSVIEILVEELKGMNIERLQVELNAVLMVGPEMDPLWKLGTEVLYNYLDSKYDVDNSWCKKIPGEILYKHAAHVFELSMELMKNQ